VIALEVFPVPGITDLPTPIPRFTIDWTGIPIMIVFLGLGIVFSIFMIIVMWVFIAYRNFQGAAFKGLAEAFTLLGLIIAKLILRNRDLDWKQNTVVYLFFGCLFRVIGMLIGNVFLFEFFYGMSYDAAFALSTIYVPWNFIQAIINVLGGIILFKLIPENIQMQAGFGKFGAVESKYEELSEEELDSVNE
jgi:riboflavin transporter FmnP